MCYSIDYQNENDEWQTLYCVRDLRNIGLIVKEEHYKNDENDPTSEDDCFCGTDLEAILNENNVSYEDTGMDIIVYNRRN